MSARHAKLATLEAKRAELSVLIVSYALVRDDLERVTRPGTGVALDTLRAGMRAADARWAAVDAEIKAVVR